MNPELQAKLVQYLDSLEKGTSKVGEFAEREIPETIREWLLWMAVENFTCAGLFLIVTLASLAMIRWMVRKCPEWTNRRIAEEKVRYRVLYRDRDPVASDLDLTERYAVFMTLAAIALFSFVGFARFAIDGAKVLIAPRVVIVEKVAELTKAATK